MEEAPCKQGATFEAHKGGSGHLTAELNGKKPQLPIDGTGKELPPSTVHRILKDLDLK